MGLVKDPKASRLGSRGHEESTNLIDADLITE